MGGQAGLFVVQLVSFSADLVVGSELRRLSDGSSLDFLPPLPANSSSYWNKTVAISTSGRFILGIMTGEKFFLQSYALIDRSNGTYLGLPGLRSNTTVLSPDESWLLTDDLQPLCLPR